MKESFLISFIILLAVLPWKIYFLLLMTIIKLLHEFIKDIYHVIQFSRKCQNFLLVNWFQ